MLMKYENRLQLERSFKGLTRDEAINKLNSMEFFENMKDRNVDWDFLDTVKYYKDIFKNGDDEIVKIITNKED